MSIGVIKTVKIVKQSDQRVNAFAAIDTKIITRIILRQEKFTVMTNLRVNANAKCSPIYQFVSFKIISHFSLNSFIFLNTIVGSQDLKCLCKHSCKEHDPNGA